VSKQFSRCHQDFVTSLNCLHASFHAASQQNSKDRRFYNSPPLATPLRVKGNGIKVVEQSCATSCTTNLLQPDTWGLFRSNLATNRVCRWATTAYSLNRMMCPNTLCIEDCPAAGRGTTSQMTTDWKSLARLSSFAYCCKVRSQQKWPLRKETHIGRR
jgi:hypothetical protein